MGLLATSSAHSRRPTSSSESDFKFRPTHKLFSNTRASLQVCLCLRRSGGPFCTLLLCTPLTVRWTRDRDQKYMVTACILHILFVLFTMVYKVGITRGPQADHRTKDLYVAKLIAICVLMFQIFHFIADRFYTPRERSMNTDSGGYKHYNWWCPVAALCLLYVSDIATEQIRYHRGKYKVACYREGLQHHFQVDH
jgi:hypothetical protein